MAFPPNQMEIEIMPWIKWKLKSSSFQPKMTVIIYMSWDFTCHNNAKSVQHPKPFCGVIFGHGHSTSQHCCQQERPLGTQASSDFSFSGSTSMEKELTWIVQDHGALCVKTWLFSKFNWIYMELYSIFPEDWTTRNKFPQNAKNLNRIFE